MSSLLRLFIVGWLCATFASVHGEADYSIVFVHLGRQVPDYAETAFEQARKFNPECPIILLANEQAILNFSPRDHNLNLTYVAAESLERSESHARFLRESTLNRVYLDGFWLFTSERFLYLSELMTQHNLQNVFHLEYDNMLYADLGEMLPIFQGCYKVIGATFDNDTRCIAGFIYIPNPSVMELLSNHFADLSSMGNGFNGNDMTVLNSFRDKYGADYMDNLPIVSKGFVQSQAILTSPYGHLAADKFDYCKNFEFFNSIFDAAAIGQFLGGIAPVHGDRRIGFINESCVFNPSTLHYEWGVDEMNRRVLYALYKGEKFRINNLHVHSKDLKMFSSLDD